MNESIRLIIVDDHTMFLDGLTAMLEKEPNMKIVAKATSSKKALNLVKTNTCDLVITDLSMDEMDGLELTREIHKYNSEIKVLVVSMHSHGGKIKKLLDAGASGYLLKNTPSDELLEAIKSIYFTGSYFSQDIKNILFSSLVKVGPQSRKGDVPLTEREKEILLLIVEEHSNPSISEKLFISLHTVETHRRNIMKKLKVHNSVGLVRKALQLGLIDVD